MSEKSQDFADVEVVHRGRQIVLPAEPEHMDYDVAIEWVRRAKEAAETPVDISETINAYPLDGAKQFGDALHEIYGFTSAIQPTYIGVPIGVDEDAKVMWGGVQIPGIEGKLNTSYTFEDGVCRFRITGRVKRKSYNAVMKIVTRTRELCRDRSIYRGKAIVVTFPQDETQFDPRHAPRFMDVRGISPDDLVLSADLAQDIERSIWTPIRKTQMLRDMDISRKRGALLFGPPGTGKTLIARNTASLCEKHGWTFMYVPNIHDLPKALLAAPLFSPCVVFGEDADKVLGGTRDEKMDNYLNVLDGVNTKGAEVMLIMTTNDIESFDAAALRPGRFDLVAPITGPDAAGIAKLLRNYGRGQLDPDADLSPVAAELAGQNAAVVEEVIKRSRLASIARANTVEEAKVITADDLLQTAVAMRRHRELATPKAQDTRSDIEKAAGVVGERVVEAVAQLIRPAPANGQGTGHVSASRTEQVRVPV